MGVDKRSVKDDVERLARRQAIGLKKTESEKIRQSTFGYADRVNVDYVKAPAVAKNEEAVLGLMILYPEHRKTVFSEGLLQSEDFFTDFNKRIFEFLKKNYEIDPMKAPDFDEGFSADEVGRIAGMKISRMHLSENGNSILRESILSLKSSVQKKTAESVSSIEDLNKLISSMRK